MHNIFETSPGGVVCHSRLELLNINNYDSDASEWDHQEPEPEESQEPEDEEVDENAESEDEASAVQQLPPRVDADGVYERSMCMSCSRKLAALLI